MTKETNRKSPEGPNIDEDLQPKRRRPSFRDFKPPIDPTKPLARESLSGLDPMEATRRVIEFYSERVDLREVSARQKGVVIRKILADLGERNLDFATMTSQDVQEYRAFLRRLVDEKTISEDYAAHVVNQWNSVMNNVFRDGSRPGYGLKMRGFRQHAKQVEILHEKDMESLVRAIQIKPFDSDHYREAFRTYVELAWSTGCRVGSLMHGNLRYCDIDWERQTIRFQHMKNKREHIALLTTRAALQLRRWTDYLQTTPAWRGIETAIFIRQDGEPLQTQWVNKALKSTVAYAGLNKRVSTHVIRKSVGTHLAQVDLDYAGRQIGATPRIVQRHYNQPSLDDLLKKRNLLPGSDFKPKTPQKLAGWASLEHQAGRLNREDYLACLEQARKLMENPGVADGRDNVEVA